jgi:hypothetical protein
VTGIRRVGIRLPNHVGILLDRMCADAGRKPEEICSAIVCDVILDDAKHHPPGDLRRKVDKPARPVTKPVDPVPMPKEPEPAPNTVGVPGAPVRGPRVWSPYELRWLQTMRRIGNNPHEIAEAMGLPVHEVKAEIANQRRKP